MRRALAALSLAAVATPVRGGRCASIDLAQSSGWLDRDGVTSRFSIQFNVVHWVPFTRIEIKWIGDQVNVEHAYNAQTEPGVGETVVVVLGRTATNPPQFVLMGSGTQSTSPHIECNTATHNNVPPPSPPHADSCPLGAVYKTINTWWAPPAGENVEIVFRTWRDAGLVRLRFWGQTGLQIESPVGATVHGISVVDGDSLIVLQLGTSCEDRVVDADGVVVSQPGQRMNCVPHRAETMHVTFNLRPPALHPPQISCHEVEPPPPPRSINGAASAVEPPQIEPPRDAVAGGYAPRLGPPMPPPPPSPPPPPPELHVGSSVRSLPDCAVGATATIVGLQPRPDGSARAHIEIRPDHWLEGFVFMLGVSGSKLDIGEGITHASRLLPSIDPSGTMIIFSFALTALPRQSTDSAVVEVTLIGASLQIRQLTCRPAPAPPPWTGSSTDGAEKEEATDRVPWMLTFVDASMSDLLLVGFAALLAVFMAAKHGRDAARCCFSSGRERTRVGGFESALPTSEEDAAMRAPVRGRRKSKDRQHAGPRTREIDDDDADLNELHADVERQLHAVGGGAQSRFAEPGAQVVD